MTNRTTGVVGAGLMGRDIAGLLAAAGHDVTLVDVDTDALAAARQYHERELSDELRAAGLSAEDGLGTRMTYATELSELSDAGFVVEAVPERLQLKRDVMASLESVLDSAAIVGTNTSALTPGDVAAEMDHPERVVLFHFANPAIERDLVEIAGDGASQAALEGAISVAESMGKTPIHLQREYRANGLSRLSASIKCAASWELLEASPAAIEAAARNLGFERGPLELIDLIGVDVHLATVDNLAEAYGDRYAPPPEVRERMEGHIEEGTLGKKSGEGFFEWDGDECVVPPVDEPHELTPVLAALVNEGHRLVDDGVADPDTVDEILRLGSGGDAGPFDLEAAFGREGLRATLEARHDETGAAVYEPVF